MTKPRYDEHSTEFGLWLREQPNIDSSLGFAASNIDFMWRNYNTGQWMFIEEKRCNGKLTWSQEQIFDIIHNACKNAKGYCGFYVLTFEHTNPDDGCIYLDGDEITKEELLQFLCFEWFY